MSDVRETNVGYGPDFIEITDEPGGGLQKIIVPISVWDNYVKDYIANRREQFLMNRLVDGVLFDDTQHNAEF